MVLLYPYHMAVLCSKRETSVANETVKHLLGCAIQASLTDIAVERWHCVVLVTDITVACSIEIVIHVAKKNYQKILLFIQTYSNYLNLNTESC